MDAVIPAWLVPAAIVYIQSCCVGISLFTIPHQYTGCTRDLCGVTHVGEGCRISSKSHFVDSCFPEKRVVGNTFFFFFSFSGLYFKFSQSNFTGLHSMKGNEKKKVLSDNTQRRKQTWLFYKHFL